jgi:spermidine/putrescine-binding protein
MMNKLCSLSAVMALAAYSGAAFAQAQSSGRVDNIWGGYAHQPTEAQVTQQEKSAGLTPSQQQQKAANDDVESVYQSLMRQTDAAQQ